MIQGQAFGSFASSKIGWILFDLSFNNIDIGNNTVQCLAEGPLEILLWSQSTDPKTTAWLVSRLGAAWVSSGWVSSYLALEVLTRVEERILL